MLDGLKTGNEALKKANEMFSIEEIEAIMDDTAEAVEKQKEIDSLLSGQLTAEDEDDVLKELDDLVASEAVGDDNQEEVGELPEVPSTDPIADRKPQSAKSKSKTKVALEASWSQCTFLFIRKLTKLLGWILNIK